MARPETMDDAAFTAWFAGFFDGEGCIYLPRKNGLAISVANTNEAVIRGIHRKLGFGQLVKTVFDNPLWNPKFEVRIVRFEDSEKLLTRLLPFLTLKVPAAKRALRRIAKSRQREMRRFARVARIRVLGARRWTHERIAKKVGVSRSCVSLTLASRTAPKTRWGPRKDVKEALYVQHHVKKTPRTGSKSKRIAAT